MAEHRRFRPLVGALALIAPLGILIAAPAAKDILKARHDHFHQLGDAAKTIRDQAQKGTPDFAAIQQAARVVNEASIGQEKWFPAGSGPEAGKTRALPKIWSETKDFAAAQRMFSEAAPKLLAAANARDIDAVKAAFGNVGKSCKNCHDNFRSPEEHE